VPAESTIDAGTLIGTSDREGPLSTGHPAASLVSESLLNYELGLALNWPRLDVRGQGFDAAAVWQSRPTASPRAGRGGMMTNHDAAHWRVPSTPDRHERAGGRRGGLFGLRG
jgi:hypothetical protein